MLFVHEYIEWGDGTVHENGWWEYDPESERLYNRNGGYHYYKPNPKDEIVESTWDKILALTIRNDDYVTGWIAPDGTFYGCAPMDHIRLAKYYLDKEEQELEEAGWLKITEIPYFLRGTKERGNGRYEYHFFNPYKYITQAQIQTLREKGLELTEYDSKYNMEEL